MCCSVKWRVGLLTLLVALMSGFAFAEETPPVDPSGAWIWERTFGNNTLNYKLRLTLKDASLSGSLTATRTDADQQIPAAEIQDAKLEGKQLSFSVTRTFNDQEFTINYQGTLDGDSLTGQSTFEFDGNVREVEWQAKRTVELADLVGTWQFTIELDNGGDPIQSTFTLSKEGDDFKGVYNSQFFGQRDARDISIKDNQLSFKVVFEQDGNEMEFSYTAKPRGDAMNGTVASGFGPPDGTPFTGKRQAQ